MARLAFSGADLRALRANLAGQYIAQSDPALLLELSTLDTIMGQPASAQSMQQAALAACRLFRRPAPRMAGAPAPRLLVVMASGDLMANTPIEFLTEGSEIVLELAFCRPGECLPDSVPVHDAVFVAIGQSDTHEPTLTALARQLAHWPVPVLNDPTAIARLSRNRLAEGLQGCTGVRVPKVVRVRRRALAGAAAGFPGAILVRPVHSHAGDGLERLMTPGEIAAYLDRHPEPEFYLTEYVDYRGSEGDFRKYRVAFVDGVAYPSHMAISAHWMIHYLNAGMTDDAAKRAAEAHWMESFATDFAAKHRRAFASLVDHIDLDYFVIDCGETPSGELLLFEADTAMLVHAMDPPDLFAYKLQPMRRLFAAVQTMIRDQLPARWSSRAAIW